MNSNTLDPNEFRRLARERASQENLVRMRSVLSVHGALRSSLRTGDVAALDRLDEAALVRRYSVSRNAVRAALTLLAEEGVVSRAPRQGTVVLTGLSDVRIDNGVGWAESEYHQHTIDTPERRWVPSTPVTRRMLATQSPLVFATDMIDRRDGEPTLLHTLYTLAEGANRPVITDALERGFDGIFEDTYGSPIGDIDCWVEAGTADARAAAQLGVAPGTALLTKSRLLWSSDGIPREYSVTHYIASRVALTTTTHGSGDADRVPAVRFDGSDGVGGAGIGSTPDPDASADRTDEFARRRSAIDVHAELRAGLRGGLFVVGDRLDEDELGERFGASRNAVRLALGQLVDEGLVCRNRRLGTVVTGVVTDLTIDNGIGWHPDETWRHHAEPLSSSTIPTPPIVAELMHTDSTDIVVTQFLDYRDDDPFLVYIKYALPSDRRRPLSSESELSFSELFQASYGASIGRIETSIHAVRAHERTAKLLRVEPGTLLLLKERLIVDENGRPREFSHSYYVASRVSLSTRSPAGSGERTVVRPAAAHSSADAAA